MALLLLLTAGSVVAFHMDEAGGDRLPAANARANQSEIVLSF
jgi:hypothetical protein